MYYKRVRYKFPLLFAVAIRNDLLEPTQSFNQSREHVRVSSSSGKSGFRQSRPIVLDLNYGSRVRSGVESTITPNQYWPHNLWRVD